MHTLLMVGYLKESFSFTNSVQPVFLAGRRDADVNAIADPDPDKLSGVIGLTMHQDFNGGMEVWTTEAQQIWEQSSHNTVIGARFQGGRLETAARQDLPSTAGMAFPDPPESASLQDVEGPFKRFSVYGYHQWDIVDGLQLTAGLAYDWLTFPENPWNAPVSFAEKRVEQLSPKAGLLWSPGSGTVVRFAYTRSLGGVQMEQSLQMEPTQVAGFVQAFRSLIPEAVAGANAGARFETYGLAVEQKLATETYVSIMGEWLNSEVERTLGAYDLFPLIDDPSNPWSLAVPASLRNNLDYREPSLLITANQLLGKDWAVGARYRLSQATLRSDFVDVADGLNFSQFEPRRHQDSVLQELNLTAVFNHRSGLTLSVEALWFLQETEDSGAGEGEENVWQLNVYAGYRFPRRRAELMVGLLNLADEDYRLSPLNLHRELPHERTLALRFRMNL